MSVVTDLGEIANVINNIDYIAVAAITTSDYPKLPNIYNATILMPPTEILMKWAEGDPYIMQNQYPAYLNSQCPDDMIVALLALLTKKNVILYMPMDEFNVFGMMLLNHIYFSYGITCNTPTTRFDVDATRIPLLLCKFYMIDAMSSQDLLASYPANSPLPYFVINKLAEELHPFSYPVTFNEYADYFNNLNASKGNNIVHPSMVKVVDKNDNLH